jgi:putative SOS response-associated peptidase YedK
MVVKLHDRMPPILHEHYEAWLDPKNGDTGSLEALLKPAEEMRVYPVSSRVNNVKNDDELLIQGV